MEPHYRTEKNRILASNCRRKPIPQLLLVSWPMVHPLAGNSSFRDNFTKHFMTDKNGLFSAALNEVSIRDREYYTDLSTGTLATNTCAQCLLVQEESWPLCQRYSSYVLPYSEESSTCCTNIGIAPKNPQADLSHMFCLEIQEFLVGGCPRYEIAAPFFTNELTFERHDRVLLNAEFQKEKLRLSCDYSSSTFNIEVVSEALKRDRTIGKARVLVEIRFVPKFRSGYISNNNRPVALLVDIRRFSCKIFPSDTDEIQRFLNSNGTLW